jgi:hypothetical protein
LLPETHHSCGRTPVTEFEFHNAILHTYTYV